MTRKIILVLLLALTLLACSITGGVVVDPLPIPTGTETAVTWTATGTPRVLPDVEGATK